MKPIFQNPWVISVVTGLIVTILGGVILNKIFKEKKHKKQSFELKTDGELEVNKDLVVGDIQDELSSQPREHKVKIGKDSNTIVHRNLIIGNKNKR